jgi:hypothetical protein
MADPTEGRRRNSVFSLLLPSSGVTARRVITPLE